MRRKNRSSQPQKRLSSPKANIKRFRKHPKVHLGLDGDKPWFVGEMKSVRVKHLGSGAKPIIKRELSVKRLIERTQVRGVHKDPHVLLNGDHEPQPKKPATGPPPRSCHGPYPTIVICGLGFAGAAAAERLVYHLGGKGRVIGIDASDRFVFIPALMAMASGFFKYEDISVPLKGWAHQAGIEFVHDTIASIDTKSRKVHTKSHAIPYDYCIVALGAGSTPLPPNFDGRTLALRNVCDAYAIWDRVVKAASINAHRAGSRRFDVKVGIIGGGPTGVQLASWMKDGLQKYLDHDYPRRGRAIVSLFHGGPDLIPGLPKKARKAALESLIDQGVSIHLNTRVHGVADSVITLNDNSRFKNDVAVFCGGWFQSPVLPTLGLSMDSRCGLKASNFLQSVDDPFVFTAGDALCFVPDDLNISGWKRAQNARLAADTLAYNIIQHSQGGSMEPLDVKDTPVIIDIRPGGILISGDKVYVSRLFYFIAQMIRILSLLKIRHPKIPTPI